MKQTILKLLLFINSILLIAYMGLTSHADFHLNTRGVIPLFLSSLLLIDVTYVSSCNIRENKTISLFCGLLALESWYILLAASGNSITNTIFFALSPVIWCVSIKFILMFLFQNSGYKYQKLINLCLTGTCIFALIGVLVSSKIFFLLYFIQFMASWLCFIFTVIYHRKRVAFVFKSEWRHIIFSLIAVIVLFLTYYFSTMRVPEHLSNFGVYIPILLFWVSIHGIILKEQNSLPLSAVFSNRQLTLLIFSGVIIFSLIAIILNGGYSLLFIMLDALFAFLYVCNIALDFNFKKGHNKIIKESKYHVALQQLQREEQLNLEFANFLHDDILQDLLSVKNMMKKADRPEVQKIITETLDNMNTYIREQMQDYHPTLLPRVVILSGYDLPVYRSEGRKIGAKGFVNKNIEPEKLISILSKIMQGILYFDREIPFIEGLTDSEKQIIQLIAEGQKRKDIASTLYISERTLSNHLQHIFEKLDVTSAVEAVTKAIQLGYIPPIC